MKTTHWLLTAALAISTSGCAVRLGGSNLLGGKQTEPASASPSQPAPAQDPAAQRRAQYEPVMQDIDALIAKLPTVQDRAVLLDQLTSPYPSNEIVKTYKDLHTRGSARTAADMETPEWAALKAKFNELDDRLAETLVLPPDVYKDKDAAQVKKVFTEEAKKWTKKDVLAVSLRYKDWGRKSGTTWQGDNQVNFDNGFMKAYVVVKGDAGNEVWQFNLRRDYLDGGKIKNDSYEPLKIARIASVK